MPRGSVWWSHACRRGDASTAVAVPASFTDRRADRHHIAVHKLQRFGVSSGSTREGFVPSTSGPEYPNQLPNLTVGELRQPCATADHRRASEVRQVYLSSCGRTPLLLAFEMQV